MRLLVTRAAIEASRTRAALEAHGHIVIVSPLTEIVGTGAVWPGGIVDALVATSAQAFTNPPGMSDEQRATLPLFVVGQRTLDAARGGRHAGPATCAADVAELVALLGAASGPPMRFVYWAGRDRKPDLEAALAEQGHRLDVVEAYVARATAGLNSDAVAALRAGTIDAVLHFSRRGATLFLEACRAATLDVQASPHLCLSADVALPLREAGCQGVKTAKAPNEAALFSLLDE